MNISMQEVFPYYEKTSNFYISGWVSVMEQELSTLLGNLSSPSVLNVVRVPQSLVFGVVFCILWCVFLYFLAIVLFFFDLQFLVNPFGIFKLFPSE